MTCNLSIVIVMISIFHAANRYSAEYLDIPQLLEENESSASIDSRNFEIGSYNFDFEENSIEDDDYLSGILKKMVEETYDLLQSDDEEKKRKLKLGPSNYKLYIRMRNKSIPRFRQNPRESKSEKGRQGGCIAKKKVFSPRQADIYGENCLIVNVDNFKQDSDVYFAKCENVTSSCESEFGNPLTYESKCEQSYKRVGLVCIPDGKELVKENQEVKYFQLQNGCTCVQKKIGK